MSEQATHVNVASEPVGPGFQCRKCGALIRVWRCADKSKYRAAKCFAVAADVQPVEGRIAITDLHKCGSGIAYFGNRTPQRWQVQRVSGD